MPLTEWLAGRLAGELDEHLGEGGLARRGLFRDGVLPRLLRRASARPPQSRRAAVGAADPRALVPALRALLVVAREAAFDSAHRIVDRLGRTGVAHPDRDGRDAAARPSRASRHGRYRGHPSRGAGARSSCGGAADRGQEMPRAASRCDAGSRSTARSFDVVNTHSSTDAWLVALAGATLAGMPPVVRTRHVSTPVNNAWTTRWLYQRATRQLVVTGEALKAQLVRDNGFDPARITSVRTGIDLDALPSARRAAVTRGACASTRGRRSRSSPRCATGRDTTISSTRGRCVREECRAGSCSSSATGRGARISKAASPRWVFATTCASPATRTTCPAWFACAEIATLPSYGDEGVPQSLMQAAACGLPAVSTPIGAIAEAVVDGETGLLVPPRDVPALATRAAASHDRRRAARAHGARRARARAARASASIACSTRWKRCSRTRREGRADVRHRRPFRTAGGAGRSRAHARGAAAPRSRCAARRRVRRGRDAAAGRCVRRRGPRAHAAVDHRSAAGRRPADAKRRRHAVDLLQRRSLRVAAATRASSSRRGVRFNTWCDTEFILRGYEAWGIEGAAAAPARHVRVRDRRLPRAHACTSCATGSA